MKLSAWAKEVGITYKAAWKLFSQGKVPNSYQLPSGTIVVRNEQPATTTNKVAIYARVSSSENRSNLDSQIDRLKQYCVAKGYVLDRIVGETASGLNDCRPKLEKLLLDRSIGTIVVEHKDRLARFGFNYIEKLLAQQGRKIEVINLAENAESDLMQDFVAIITSFTARLYGRRRSQRKTETIIAELNRTDDP